MKLSSVERESVECDPFNHLTDKNKKLIRSFDWFEDDKECDWISFSGKLVNARGRTLSELNNNNNYFWKYSLMIFCLQFIIIIIIIIILTIFKKSLWEW